MKTIVSKKEINDDVGLAIIKAFRVTNKRCGEAKQRGPEGHEEYLQFAAHLRDLADQAEKNDPKFHIWVNGNGQTGHTYDKDYRESPDELHDYEAHQAEVEACLARQQELDFEASSDPEDN